MWTDRRRCRQRTSGCHPGIEKHTASVLTAINCSSHCLTHETPQCRLRTPVRPLLTPISSLVRASLNPRNASSIMKFSATQLLALCGLVAFITQPVVAQEITTCDVDCVGPYNACSWEAIASSDQSGGQKKCESDNAKCISDCIAKKGKVKFVYTEAPHPEATQKSTSNRSQKAAQTKAPKRGNASLRTPNY